MPAFTMWSANKVSAQDFFALVFTLNTWSSVSQPIPCDSVNGCGGGVLRACVCEHVGKVRGM